MSFQRAKKANVYPKKHRSGNITWQVCVGTKADGKKDVRSRPTEAEARTFADKWNLRLVETNKAGLEELNEIEKYEIFAARKKLEAFNATIPEAVNFFITYARPDKGQITTEEAMDFFLKQKARIKCSPKYLKNFEKTFLKPFTKAFPTRIVSEISHSEADKYIDSHKSTWNGTTTRSHISYLRTFYEFLKKKGYAKLNPFEDVENPCKSAPEPKALTVEETAMLLQCALDKDLKPECAAMALVCFCGIRVEEVGRLSWSSVNLTTRKVTLEGDVPKKEKRRVNEISENAVEWLRICSMPSGDIAPNDYEQRMKRLRGQVNKEHPFKYPQNGMRQSFAGYHLAQFENASKTALMMGHPDASLIYSTYYNCVSKEEAGKYWGILPRQVIQERKRKEREADEQRRKNAEFASPIGQVVEIDGEWVPLTDEEPPEM